MSAGMLSTVDVLVALSPGLKRLAASWASVLASNCTSRCCYFHFALRVGFTCGLGFTHRTRLAATGSQATLSSEAILRLLVACLLHNTSRSPLLYYMAASVVVCRRVLALSRVPHSALCSRIWARDADSISPAQLLEALPQPAGALHNPEEGRCTTSCK